MTDHKIPADFGLADFTDHQFAAYLRRRNAINNMRQDGRVNYWYEGDVCVAAAIYSGAADREIYVRTI